MAWLTCAYVCVAAVHATFNGTGPTGGGACASNANGNGACASNANDELQQFISLGLVSREDLAELRRLRDCMLEPHIIPPHPTDSSAADNPPDIVASSANPVASTHLRPPSPPRKPPPPTEVRETRFLDPQHLQFFTRVYLESSRRLPQKLLFRKIRATKLLFKKKSF